MIQNEAIITSWGPQLLKMELDKLLWTNADHIEIKQLWDNLCTYLYLPRLASVAVLEDTIRKGVGSTEFFGYAQGIEGVRYVDLKFNMPLVGIERSGVLVRKDVAQKQIDGEEEKRKDAASEQTEEGGIGERDDTVETDGDGSVVEVQGQQI